MQVSKKELRKIMKLKKTLFVKFAAIVAIFLSACTSNADCCKAAKLADGECIVNSANVASLNLTAWQPVFVLGHENVRVPQNAETDFGKVFISFKNSPEGIRVHGMSGVNIFNGYLKFERDGEADFSKIVSTMRAGKYMSYERIFLEALDETEYITMSADTLNFYEKDDGKMHLLMSLKKLAQIPDVADVK